MSQLRDLRVQEKAQHFVARPQQAFCSAAGSSGGSIEQTSVHTVHKIELNEELPLQEVNPMAAVTICNGQQAAATRSMEQQLLSSTRAWQPGCSSTRTEKTPFLHGQNCCGRYGSKTRISCNSWKESSPGLTQPGPRATPQH